MRIFHSNESFVLASFFPPKKRINIGRMGASWLLSFEWKILIWIGGTAVFCSHINNLLEPSRSTFGKAWNENIRRSDFELPDLVHGARCHAVLVQNATSVLHQTQIVAPVVFILDQGNTLHFKLLKLDFPKFGHYLSDFFVFIIHIKT